MKLIVGLGNPGKKYENTRHNIGFDIVDELSKELGIDNFRSKFQGEIGEATLREEKIMILKPQTFMNLSGNSVAEVVKFYKLNPAQDVFVIYDDLDLPLGKLRMRVKGSAGGHNGMKSIISHLGNEFIRLKFGIGKPRDGEEVVNFVLNKFAKAEEEMVDEMLKKSVKGIKSALTAKNIENVISKIN